MSINNHFSILSDDEGCHTPVCTSPVVPSAPKKKATTFRVATSYLDSKFKLFEIEEPVEQKPNGQHNEQKPEQKIDRSVAYACLQPCRLVTEAIQKIELPNGDIKVVYGVCRRTKCTFAHSLLEMRFLPCRWAERCRNWSCRYIHPDEDTTEVLQRLWKNDPESFPRLPATNDLTRETPSAQAYNKSIQKNLNTPNKKVSLDLPHGAPKMAELGKAWKDVAKA